MEFLGTIAGCVWDCVFPAAQREVGYCYHYKDNIEALKKEVYVDLALARNLMQTKMDAAKREGEIIKDYVEQWMKDVVDIIEGVEIFLDNEVKAKANRSCCCLKWWCTTTGLYSRYRSGKEADLMTKAISEHRQLMEKFEILSHPAPPPGIVCPSEGFYVFKSRELFKSQIMEALDDDKVSIIGVCGMGGAGKTTLVDQVIKQAEDSKTYDAIVKSVVSQTVSIGKIQQDLARMLGLKLDEDDESGRAGLLWREMKKKNQILVILDDIWRKIDLRSIGIPFGDDHKGCKIVLTTRRIQVCHVMNARPFQLGLLSEEESWDLFKEIVEQDIENSDINQAAKDIVDHCGGLIIAILTVGSALRKKETTAWNDAAWQLKNSTPIDIEGMEEQVFSTLKWSYDYVETEGAKSLFLHCCLFPEDHNIPIELLVCYAMGLRWFKGVATTEAARVKVRNAVSTLTSSYLLMVGDDKYKECVRMHDVVREVARKIASVDDHTDANDKHTFMVEAGVELREWPNIETFEDFTSISLISNNISELPDGLQCPKLQSLLLQQCPEIPVPFEDNNQLTIPDCFFEGMVDLKVVDLSSNSIIPSLPSSLSSLTMLTTLYLEFCELGDNVSLIGNLRNLWILSLVGSDIKTIPISFNQLTNLRLLDLTGCWDLTVIPQGVFSCLCKLEELYMRYTFTKWGSKGKRGSGSNVRLVELTALRRLTNLHIEIEDSSYLLDEMPCFQNLTSFFIAIGLQINWDREDIYNEYRRANAYSRVTSLWVDIEISRLDWIKDLLQRSDRIELGSDFLNREFHELVNYHHGFNGLKSLHLIDCDEMEYLFNSKESETPLQECFHKLEELNIEDTSIVGICHSPLPAMSFGKVKVLSIWSCSEMLSIGPIRFQNLEVVNVEMCSSMINVFDFEGIVIRKAEAKLLSMLKEIRLKYLHTMTEIWKTGYTTQLVSLHNLKTVYIHGCDKLKILFPTALSRTLVSLEKIEIERCDELEEIFWAGMKAEEEQEEIVLEMLKNKGTDHQPSITITSTPSFGNLSSIEVGYCDKLRNIFTPSIVESLVQLKRLKLEGCLNVQEIMTDDEKGASTVVFPSLHEMELTRLSSLTCFSRGTYTIEFPALEELRICGCPKMETFGYGVQVAPKLNNMHEAMRNQEEKRKSTDSESELAESDDSEEA